MRAVRFGLRAASEETEHLVALDLQRKAIERAVAAGHGVAEVAPLLLGIGDESCLHQGPRHRRLCQYINSLFPDPQVLSASPVPKLVLYKIAKFYALFEVGLLHQREHDIGFCRFGIKTLVPGLIILLQ